MAAGRHLGILQRYCTVSVRQHSFLYVFAVEDPRGLIYKYLSVRNFARFTKSELVILNYHFVKYCK